MAEVIIRKGTEADIADLLRLIQELAEYEKAPNEVVVTEKQLLKDGFEGHPSFEFLVAEVNGSVEGIALYFYAYSTWKGKYLYLEDLVVRESQRQLGLGTKLFLAVKDIAEKEGVKRMGWQVLDWNEPAIKFYEKHKAELSSEWLNGRFHFE